MTTQQPDSNQMSDMPRWPIVCLAVGETLVWSSTFYVFPAMLLRWESALGWSRPELTLAMLLASIATAFASLACGRIIDKGYGHWQLAICTVVAGLGIGLLSQVTSLAQFYILWVLIGSMLAGALYDPCFAVVTRALGAGARRSITGITLVAGFASTISFPLAHKLSDTIGWQNTLIVFAAIAVFGAAPLLLLGGSQLERHYRGKRVSQPQPHTKSGKSFTFTRQPLFWLLATALALGGVVHGSVLQHLIPMLSERGLSLSLAVLAVSFIGPMQVAGRVVIALLEKRIDNHGAVIVTFGGMALSITVLLIAIRQPSLLWLFIVLFGGGYGILSIIRPVIARDMLGEADFGTKSGVLAFVYVLGAGAAPYFGSLLWHIGGYGLMLVTMIIMMLCAIGLYLAARRLRLKQLP